MKTLYLQCNMGAAGDMLMAALWELLPDQSGFLEIMNQLPHVEVSAEKSVRCGVFGTHMSVRVHGHEEGHDHHHHAHSTLADIFHAIDHLPVSETVRSRAKAVYNRIAEAESRVHGQTVEAVHFHEVGAWDAVADVVGVCLAMEQLNPSRILASPVHVGCGQVRCAHGLLPVPAPATALLLQDVPIYGGSVQGELCTPTGAALLTEFVSEFCDMPVMKTKQIGYGMGTKEFPQANCVRAFWGETEDSAGQIAMLSCNLDDMTAEALAFAQETLFEAGALDVYTTAIGMKKSRAGVMLTCLCPLADAERFAVLMLKHTTTLGVRKQVCDRYTLSRRIETVDTPYGSVRVKFSEGYGIRKAKPEFEDLARLAKEHGKSIAEMEKDILKLHP